MWGKVFFPSWRFSRLACFLSSVGEILQKTWGLKIHVTVSQALFSSTLPIARLTSVRGSLARYHHSDWKLVKRQEFLSLTLRNSNIPALVVQLFSCLLLLLLGTLQRSWAWCLQGRDTFDSSCRTVRECPFNMMLSCHELAKRKGRDKTALNAKTDERIAGRNTFRRKSQSKASRCATVCPHNDKLECILACVWRGNEWSPKCPRRYLS